MAHVWKRRRICCQVRQSSGLASHSAKQGLATPSPTNNDVLDCSSSLVAGDMLDVKVHRKGEEVALRYRLHQRRPLVPVLHGVDCVPSYLIVGGLVFVPLSIPFLEHAYGGARGS